MTDLDEQPSEHPDFEFRLAAELEGGVYANVVAVWHSAYEFTLDFCATQQAEAHDDSAPVVIPCRVVSRVRIPVTLIFDLLRALNANMTAYEAAFGEIKRPGEQA